MPMTQKAIARIAGCVSSHLRHSRVDDRGDDERDDAERLHDDQRCEPEAGELTQDREPEQHAAEHPPRAAGQPPELRRRSVPACGRIRASPRRRRPRGAGTARRARGRHRPAGR